MLERRFITTLFSLFLSSFLFGQTVEMLADLNPGSGSSLYEVGESSIVYKDMILFSATDGTHGIELWKYDGTTVSMVKDINVGLDHSLARAFYFLNDKVVFTATDGIHGVELWETDGTEAGTKMIKDIFAGSEDGVFFGGNFSLSEHYFHVSGDVMYFAGVESDPFNIELWKTDGTESGTVLVKNIDEEFGTLYFGSEPAFFTEHQGEIYFGTRGDGLWKTDGTTQGTVLVQNEDPDSNFGFEPEDLVSMGDYLLFFKDNYGLWRSDGTKEGTIKLMDFENLNALNWRDRKIVNLNGQALFPANDGIHGSELWTSDGTVEGTKMVIDLEPGADGYPPQYKIVYKDKMYYKGDDGQSGIELYVTDGTEAGTHIVKDIDPGSSGSIFIRHNIYTDGDFIYFGAGEGFEDEMWVSDGTEEGTYMIDIEEGQSSSDPVLFRRFRDKIFCFAAVGSFGYEPYLITVDGLSATEEISQQNLFNIYPNPNSGYLNIEYKNQDQCEIEIFDMHGRLILSVPTHQNNIDISALEDGMYLVKMIDKRENISQSKILVLKK